MTKCFRQVQHRSLLTEHSAKSMADKIKPADNESNMGNANKGTAGTNKQHDQDQGNRGKQLNPDQAGKKK